LFLSEHSVTYINIYWSGDATWRLRNRDGNEFKWEKGYNI